MVSECSVSYFLQLEGCRYDVEKDKLFLENFEREMLEYDEHLTMTLDVYLEYLRYLPTLPDYRNLDHEDI